MKFQKELISRTGEEYSRIELMCKIVIKSILLF